MNLLVIFEDKNLFGKRKSFSSVDMRARIVLIEITINYVHNTFSPLTFHYFVCAPKLYYDTTIMVV